MQNDKTWFKDCKQISRRLKESSLADVDVSFMFSAPCDPQSMPPTFCIHLQRIFTRILRVAKTKPFRGEHLFMLMLLFSFDVAKVSTHQHTKSWECSIGILQSLFKKVQLNSTALAILKLHYISKWLLRLFFACGIRVISFVYHWFSKQCLLRIVQAKAKLIRDTRKWKTFKFIYRDFLRVLMKPDFNLLPYIINTKRYL